MPATTKRKPSRKHAVIKNGKTTTANVKASNPKDAIGCRKVPFHILPWPVIGELAIGMLEGGCKYGSHNYRVIGVRASVYFSATMRHLTAWLEGEDIDPESGLSHISKAMTSLLVLRDAMIRGKMVDDRPPGTLGFIAALNAQTVEVIGRYPKPERPFLSTDVAGPDIYSG